MTDVFIGRQAIYNPDRSVFSYELLFRSADASVASFADADRATAEVIVNALTVFGLRELAGDRPVFVNITAGFLEQLERLPLPPQRMVLELLEDTEPTQEVIDRVRALKERGVQVALDDYVHHPRLAPLVELADYIKVELPAHDPADLPRVVRELRRSGAALLAEKVESPETFEHCRALGFDLFQGFFLSRPENVRSSDLPPASTPVLDVLAELQRPDASAAEIEAAIARDTGLSYKLLRYLNSPHFPVRTRIDSLHRAVVCLGTEELRRWATLMLLGSARHSHDEMVLSVLIRARFTEGLAASGDRFEARKAFMAGLLSGLDIVLNAPLDTILERLPLEPELHAAVARHEGAVGTLLKAVLAYEHGQYASLLALGIHADIANDAYLEAIRWGQALRAQW